VTRAALPYSARARGTATLGLMDVPMALAEWTVLVLLSQRPAHGFAVSQLTAPDGELGRIWRIPRPVIYRAIGRLVEADLITPESVEPGLGPQRTIYRVTAQGRLEAERWLSTPVEHVRDIRSHLLIKLALLYRAGRDPADLLRRQRAALEPIARAVQAPRAEPDGFEEILLAWRRATAAAALGFLDEIAAKTETGRSLARAAVRRVRAVRLGRTGPAALVICLTILGLLLLAHAIGPVRWLSQRHHRWRAGALRAPRRDPGRERGVAAVTGTSPTARQRELGTRLRELRAERGMTVEEVAGRLLCSATKISRLETAARRPSLRDVRDLCELYEVGTATSAELMDLAREARAPGWWTRYDDLNLDPYIGLEEAAVAITCFSLSYLPGLLQTRDYAVGIIKTVAPDMNPQIAGHRAEARMRRQLVLEKADPPRYHVFLDESVLRRAVGGPACMAAQLGKVLEAVRDGRAAVQVIPFSAGAYPAADGYFVLLEFGPAAGLWPVVFVEGLAGNQYLERRAEIARYREAIEGLCASALSSADSAVFIGEVRDGLTKRAPLRSG